MFKVTVRVTLRDSILDPQGNATQHALETLGFETVEKVRIGKYIELNVGAGDDEEARRIAREACDKLLANPVMDDYEVISVENLA